MWWLSLLASLLLAQASAESSCQSCFGSCDGSTALSELGAVACDCSGDERCTGGACFVKLDRWTEEAMTSVSKGCADAIPAAEGCTYTAHLDAVHCYCTGDDCNAKLALSNFAPAPIEKPKSTCCECYRDDRCAPEKCESTCEGDYCYYSFPGDEQGCGHGRPGLFPLLRNPDPPGELLCTQAMAGAVSITHGCVCTGDKCNLPDAAYASDLHVRLNSTTNPEPKQHYCYSLKLMSDRPFEEAIFRKAGTCQGNFCFVQLVTSAVAVETVDYMGDDEEEDDDWEPTVSLVQETTYELLAGCISMSDKTQAQPGCSTEWTEEEGAPSRKHCVCDTHLCNYWTQLSDESLEKYLSTDRRYHGTSRTPPEESARKKNDLYVNSGSTFAGSLALPLTVLLASS